MDVAIDTSAWVQADRGAIGSMARTLVLHHARLVVPEEVLSEIVAQDNGDRAFENLQKFALLESLLPPGHLVVTRWRDCADQEQIVLLERTPSTDALVTRVWLRLANDRTYFDEWQVTLREGATHALAKDESLAFDKGARESLRKQFGDGARRDEFPRDFDLEWFKSSGAFYAKVVVGEPRGPVLERPRGSPAILLWSYCQALTTWGAVQSAVAPGTVCDLPKLGRNHWVDNRIAAASAYSRWLITCDQDQLWKLDKAATNLRLAVRGVSPFEFACGLLP